MFALLLFAALTSVPQKENSLIQAKEPVPPEQVLAWQLEGLTQEEIREEVKSRGLTEYAEEPLRNALGAAGADAETIQVVHHARAPKTLWKLGLRLPAPTDYLYEVAGAILWKDWGAALQSVQSEEGNQPGNPDVRLIHAHLLRMAEDWIAAYGEVTEAVRLEPQSPYAHGLRSTICYHSRLTECAVREAATFVMYRPLDAAAYLVLGHAKELQGHDDEAMKAYEEAKQLHPTYADTYAGIGRVHARAGEFEKSIAAFTEAIRIDGNVAEFHYEMAQVYQAEGYTRKAIEKLKQAKKLEPGRPEIRLALGNAYLVAEQYAEAIKEYKELLESAPQIDIARTQLAKALRADGRDAEADRVYLDLAAQPEFAKPQ